MWENTVFVPEGHAILGSYCKSHTFEKRTVLSNVSSLSLYDNMNCFSKAMRLNTSRWEVFCEEGLSVSLNAIQTNSI